MFGNRWKRMPAFIDSQIRQKKVVIIAPGHRGFPKVTKDGLPEVLATLEARLPDVYFLPWIENDMVAVIVASYNIAHAWTVFKSVLTDVAKSADVDDYETRRLATVIAETKALIEKGEGITLPD